MRRRDIWLTLVPLLLWVGALYSRPLAIHPSCDRTDSVNGCLVGKVPAIDRPGIGNINGDADFYSYAVQNSVGVLAAVGPSLYQGALLALGNISPPVAIAAAATDTVLFAQTWFINGFLNESARLVTGRARPYLYPAPERGQSVDPLLLTDPQNYTSFYSGHTSFVTTACFSLLFMLWGRRASAGLIVFAALLSQSLIVSTGVFRILAGRHFLTDVLVAIAMGTLCALLVAILHRRPETCSSVEDG